MFYKYKFIDSKTLDEYDFNFSKANKDYDYYDYNISFSIKNKVFNWYETTNDGIEEMDFVSKEFKVYIKKFLKNISFI